MARIKKTTAVVWRPPLGKRTVPRVFVGTWRITELKEFDAEYLDLCGRPKVKISTRGSGMFAFGAVEAEIDGRMDEVADGRFSFSFEGQDESDPFFGHGYCMVQDDQLTGRLFCHFGDDFTFTARRNKKIESA